MMVDGGWWVVGSGGSSKVVILSLLQEDGGRSSSTSPALRTSRASWTFITSCGGLERGGPHLFQVVFVVHVVAHRDDVDSVLLLGAKVDQVLVGRHARLHDARHDGLRWRRLRWRSTRRWWRSTRWWWSARWWWWPTLERHRWRVARERLRRDWRVAVGETLEAAER